MQKSASSTLAAAGALALTLGSLISVPQAVFAEEGASVIEEGKALAFNRKKGNCLACHKIKGGSLEGNIGPSLVNMTDRYPDKALLRDQIWDATQVNPYTIMPPYGKYRILTKEELDKVVEFIYTL